MLTAGTQGCTHSTDTSTAEPVRSGCEGGAKGAEMGTR